MPPSIPNSFASILHQIVKSLPAFCLQARITSQRSRERFSTLPPYSSSRKFVAGERNSEKM